MKPDEPQRYSAQDQRLCEEAEPYFNESERVLNLLRTQTALPLPTATSEEIISWMQQLRSRRH